MNNGRALAFKNHVTILMLWGNIDTSLPSSPDVMLQVSQRRITRAYQNQRASGFHMGKSPTLQADT
jgi:hypothetical protein